MPYLGVLAHEVKAHESVLGLHAIVELAADPQVLLLNDLRSRIRVQQAQLLISHPNYTGMQMDQLTRLYIPPFFIENLKIWQGDDLVMAMDGGIAISEDPNIRFNYKPNGAGRFRAEGIDTSKNLFKDEWPVEKPML